MDDILASLLTPEQQALAQQRAQQQGLMSLGFGLLGASQGQRGQPRPGFGQILAQAGPQAMQAYQGSFDQTLKNILVSQQLQEAQRKRQQEISRQSALARLAETLPEGQRELATLFPEEYAKTQFQQEPEAVRSARIFAANPELAASAAAMKRAGASNVTVPVYTGTEKKYGETFASGLATEDLNLYKAAQSAPSQLDTIKETKNLLDQGKVFTGSFANNKLRIAAAGQALGITGKDTNEIITNTQRLFANRAKATLDNVRASGLGAGQGFTDRDREFLEKATLGNIEFTSDALKRQIEIEEKVARGSVSRWNERYKQIPKSALQGTGLDQILSPIELRNSGQRLRYNPATGKVE
jgi:hypothetical protein